jgi:hypothetical protein
MNFKNFVCITCEKEKEDDNFLIFTSKNQGKLCKSNNVEIKKKSLLTSSDNNNSTNNVLEIIEYPYNYDNYTDSNDFTPVLPPPPEKPIIKKENNFNTDDLFLAGIKPPKLFNEGNKEKTEPIVINEIINNKNNEETKEKKVIKQIEIINKEKDNNNNENDLDKKQSKKSSSLINNEDNLAQNKAFLNKYYSNCISGRNENEKDKIIFEKKSSTKKNKDKKKISIKKEKNNKSEPHIKTYKKNAHKINTLKKRDLSNNIMKINKEDSIIINDENKLLEQNKNIMKFRMDKLKEEKIKNKSELEKHNKTNNNANTNKNTCKSLIPNDNTIKKRFIKVNLNKKMKIKIVKKELEQKYKQLYIKSYPKQNKSKELDEIKSQKKIINNIKFITKNNKHLSNSQISNTLLNKINYRNTFSNSSEKRKKIKNNYQAKTFSSKSYVNPFATLYIKKKSFI